MTDSPTFEVRRRSTRLATPRSTNKTKVESPSLVQEDAVDPFQDEDEPVSDLTPEEDDDDVLPTKPKPKGKKGRTPKRKQRGSEGAGAEDDQYDPSNGEADVDEPPKKRKRAPKPEPVYVIPDVEKRTSTFKGRLGYACLNTVLRNKKPANEAIFCSRTCRLDTLKQKGIEFAKELGVQNVEDLLKMIQWNEDNNIRFMRISSELFPYASHGVHGYSLSFCAPLLAKVGELANKYNHRLTTHPGQYTQLGSPKPAVIAAAVRELKYHCEMLDLMGIGKDGVMIVHGGGVYGDKPSAIERIKKTITEVLPQNVRDRLVLENDEICYNAEDLLPICEELQVPLVFDYHHDALYPSNIPRTEIISRANAIFHSRGIKPKQHLSEARQGAETLMEKRKHSARCERLPDELDDDMDLMIEAKDKEQAVFQLYRIYDLQPVIWESLRPPSDDSKQVQEARENKRSPRKKTVKKDEDDDLDNDVDEAELMGADSLLEASQSTLVVSEEVVEAPQAEEVTEQIMKDVLDIAMDIRAEAREAKAAGGKRKSPRKKATLQKPEI
ncbi:hypothetical protein ONZ45_g1535 [Pleurotus djamor]|nr:hypothetical protein ONZ45_g1535 [Pleurotus djamor]